MQAHRPTGITNAVFVLAATTLAMAASLALIAAALFLLTHLDLPQLVRPSNF